MTRIKDKFFANKYNYFDGKAIDNSTVFFSRRLSSAFPGVRGLKEFTRIRDIKRQLSRLLANPLKFEESLVADANTDPIWFFRGTSGLYVDKFKHLSGRRFLIGWDELKIKRIVVFIDNGRYYGSYLYIETSDDKPCGLYKYSKDNLDKIRASHEDYGEEYAVINYFSIIKKRITKQEEDDGHTKVLGNIIQIPRNKTEIRIRHINRYNLILAAKESPFNCDNFRHTSQKYFEGLLNGTISLEDFNEYLYKFPKMHW